MGIIESEIPAFYAKFVDGLRMRDVQVDWGTVMPAYFSDALRVEEFKELTVDAFAGRQAQTSSGAAIVLKHGTGVAITQSRALPGTRTFLQMDHVGDRRVFVNYDLHGAAKVMMPPNQRFDTQSGTPATKSATR